MEGGAQIKKFIKLLLTTAAILVTLIILFGAMMFVDAFHQYLSGFARNHLGFDHYFSGESWFSVLAAFVAATPGVLCGILALIQTRHIHKLEARYHRPSLSLHNACLEIFWVDKINSIQSHMSQDFYERLIERKKLDTSNLFRIKLEFEAKNEIEIKAMRLKEIVFFVNGKKYNTTANIVLDEKNYKDADRKFERNFKSGKVVYCLENEYLPKISKVSAGDEKTFWKDIAQFMAYKKTPNVHCRHVQTILKVEIDYEYLEAQTEQVQVRIYWDGERNLSTEYGKNENYHGAKLETSNGYFTYDGKR